jgi:hypothetical protein
MTTFDIILLSMGIFAVGTVLLNGLITYLYNKQHRNNPHHK